jgi:hypothetical protein
MVSANADDLAAARAKLAQAGIQITREVDIGGRRLLVMTDPDGQEVCIVGPGQ